MEMEETHIKHILPSTGCLSVGGLQKPIVTNLCRRVQLLRDTKLRLGKIRKIFNTFPINYSFIFEKEKIINPKKSKKVKKLKFF